MNLSNYYRTTVAKILYYTLGSVLGQLIAPPPTCPGDTFTFRCTVTGDMHGITLWKVGDECILTHSTTHTPAPCGSGSPFIAASGTGFGTSATSFISTLSGIAELTLNGTLVECFGPAFSRGAGNRVGNRTVQIIGPPSVPTLSCIDLSEDVSGAVNVTVSWTLSGGDSADFYLINITTNASESPHGGLLNITTTSVTQHELTGFMTGYEYNITVRGVNCRNQEGNQSEPLKIEPQVPAAPVSDVCAVYDTLKRTLKTIDSTWNELDPVTISEECPSGRDIIARYDLAYTTDSGIPITTCGVDGTECSNGRCGHKLQGNTTDSRCQPPVSQFSGEDVTVSVTARNIVGRSNPAVSRNISGTNDVLAVYINTTNPRGAFVKCTFHPVYNCSIDYGTDPSYTSLVHRDTSSTQGRTATITLSLVLRDDTTYYYIVSAESNSHCVRVQGKFKTGCSLADLTSTDAVRQCADRGFEKTMSIPSGVVCYSRTNAGSEAVYVCDDGSHHNGAATRVCQSDGVWNGSILQCMPNLENQGNMQSLNISAAVGIAVASTTVVVFIAGFLAGVLVYHCISKLQSQGSKSESSPSHQQQQTISSSNPLQQTGPEYAEVIKLRQNRTYELTQTGIEMRANEAYQSTQH